MEKLQQPLKAKLQRREIQRSMMDYSIKPAGIDNGRLIKAFVKNDGSCTLIVWRDSEIKTMIEQHLKKPGTHMKTFLNAMSAWYMKQLEEGDDMRNAWAEACMEAMHVVQWRTTWPDPPLDLFAV